MGRSINLPFLQLPEIKISTEEAYKTLTNGGVVKIEVLRLSPGSDDASFMYLKEHPRRRGKFICSRNKSFKPFETFCIARTEEIFLSRYRGADMFYLFEQ